MKIKTFSIKTKIIISVFLLSLSLSALVAVFIYFYIGNVLVSEKIKSINETSIEQVHESVQIIEKYKLFAKMLGTRFEPVDFLLKQDKKKGKELLDIFFSYIKEDSKYLAIYLLDKNGIGLVSTDERFVGQDYSFRNYFKKALSGETWIDVAIGKTTNQFGYYFSYPVKDYNNSILGVLVVKINNQEIDNAILNSEISNSDFTTTMFVDEYGVILSSNKSERFLKSLGNITSQNKEIIKETERFFGKNIEKLQYDNVQKIIDDKGNGIIKFYDAIDKETENISINKFPNLPFFLVTEISIENIENLIFLTVFWIVLVMICGILLSSLVFYKFISIFISPLKKFGLLSEAISRGDFSKRIDLNTKDEFGELAVSFNSMVKNLEDSYKNLDQKVKNQTKDINDKAKDLGDQKSAILNILEDVQKEKEKTELLANDLEKFKLAVDNASDQVVIADVEGVVVYGNRAIERITGFKPEEAIGKKAGVLWKTPMPIEYYQNLWDVIKNQKKTFISEIQNKRKNGELYIANISISPVLDDENKVIYFVAIEHDITKEKEIDKAKTEFVSLASHQLRTPLSAINWYTEMLLAGDAGKINGDQKKYLLEVATGNRRMVDLVDALLNVSRLDLGTFMIEPKNINVIEMAKSVVGELKPQIIEKKLNLEEFYADNIGDFNADEKLLRMILQNLLSNAVKYNSTNGLVKITISIIKKDESFGEKITEEDSLAFSVSDSGIGITNNQQEKIFSKLFRADNARESDAEGTGLGLYIVKSIIDQSGGKVWFNSVEGKGTTFYIVFPLDGMKKKEGTKKLD